MKTSIEAMIRALPEGGWVRVECVRRTHRGIDLLVAVARGRRGRVTTRWRVSCVGVRELHVADLNGGGMRLYSSSHPAARQYAAGRARLRWCPGARLAEARGVLLAAHTHLVDDWIPFDRYAPAVRPNATVVAWHGPIFIMKTYARALRSLGLRALVNVGTEPRPGRRPRCLHFGDSFIVADRFEVGWGDVAADQAV